MESKRVSNIAVIAVLFLAEVSVAFETSMIYAALKRLIEVFGDPVTVGWMVTLYLLLGAGASAVAGRLGDMYGRKKLMVIMLAFAVSGSALSAFGGSFELVLAGRAMQGLGLAAMPLAFGIVREVFPPDRVPFNNGVLIAGAGTGTALGLVIGGLLIDNLDWHWIFIASCLLALRSLIAVALVLPRSTKLAKVERLDWLGLALFLPAIGGLLVAISKSGEWGFSDIRVLLPGVAGIVLLALWVWRSVAAPDPFIDVRLLAQRNVWVANLIISVLALGYIQVTMIMALMVQNPVWTGFGLGASATIAGLAKVPSNIITLGAGLLAGWLAVRSGNRAVVLLAAICEATAWLAIYFFHGSIVTVAFIICFISFFGTMIYTAVPNIIVEAVPAERTSEATGMMVVIRTAVSAIGAQILAVLFASSTATDPNTGAHYPDATAFTVVIAYVIVGTLICGALSFLLRKGRMQTGTEGVLNNG